MGMEDIEAMEKSPAELKIEEIRRSLAELTHLGTTEDKNKYNEHLRMIGDMRGKLEDISNEIIRERDRKNNR